MPGDLLEREHAELVAMSRHRLQPDRQAGGGATFGTEIAGSPVALMYQHDFIQSM